MEEARWNRRKPSTNHSDAIRNDDGSSEVQYRKAFSPISSLSGIVMDARGIHRASLQSQRRHQNDGASEVHLSSSV